MKEWGEFLNSLQYKRSGEGLTTVEGIIPGTGWNQPELVAVYDQDEGVLYLNNYLEASTVSMRAVERKLGGPEYNVREVDGDSFPIGWRTELSDNYFEGDTEGREFLDEKGLSDKEKAERRTLMFDHRASPHDFLE